MAKNKYVVKDNATSPIEVPIFGLDDFFKVVDAKQVSQKKAGWFEAEELTGILSCPQTQETCRKIQDFFNNFGAARGAPVDWDLFTHIWDDEHQDMAGQLDGFVLWGDPIDFPVVRTPVEITAKNGFAFLFDELKWDGKHQTGVPGFGGTRVAKLLARNFPQGVVAWDEKNFRSLWGIRATSESFVAFQEHCQEFIQNLLLELGRRFGLSVEEAIARLEERAIRPGSQARFQRRRDLPKLLDEFFQGLPAYFMNLRAGIPITAAGLPV